MPESPRYTHDGAPEDAYRAAAQTWDGRYGAAIAQARNWRLIAVLLTVLLFLLSGAVFWTLQQRRDVPYVVVLDERGDIAKLEVAEHGYTPTEQQIAYHLQQFVQWVRARPLDPKVFSRNWEQAYAFMSRDSQLKMNAYVQANRPEQGLGKIAREVQLRNIRLRGDKTFEVTWHEEEWQDGQRITEADYTGSFVVEIVPPSAAEAILKNPLGLTIVEFGWSPDRSALGG